MSEVVGALIILTAKYGPQWVAALVAALHKEGTSPDDLLAVLNEAKPYSDYFPAPVEQPPAPFKPAEPITPATPEELATIPTVKDPAI